jgi:predicted nucleic acid-binding Zn ribbon protein
MEVMQKVSDKPLARHIKCGGKLEKQWSRTGFQFKGTGWYVTDYAGKSKDAKEDKESKSDSSESKKSDSSESKKSDSSEPKTKSSESKSESKDAKASESKGAKKPSSAPTSGGGD